MANLCSKRVRALAMRTANGLYRVELDCVASLGFDSGQERWFNWCRESVSGHIDYTFL